MQRQRIGVAFLEEWKMNDSNVPSFLFLSNRKWLVKYGI